MRFNLSTDNWQALGLLTLVVLVTIALVFDLKQRRIPNRLVLLVLLAGVSTNLMGSQPWFRDAGLLTQYPGALGPRGAVLGALAGLAAFLPFYLLRAMGAGDVKLMAGIGSFVGPVAALNVALFIMLIGGVLAVVRMAYTRTSRQVLANVVTAMSQVWPGSDVSFDPATQSAEQMPYGLAIAAGLMAYGVWIFGGRSPIVNF